MGVPLMSPRRNKRSSGRITGVNISALTIIDDTNFRVNVSLDMDSTGYYLIDVEFTGPASLTWGVVQDLSAGSNSVNVDFLLSNLPYSRWPTGTYDITVKLMSQDETETFDTYTATAVLTIEAPAGGSITDVTLTTL